MESSCLEMSSLSSTVTSMGVFTWDSTAPVHSWLQPPGVSPQWKKHHLAPGFSTPLWSHLGKTRHFLKIHYASCLEHPFEVCLYFPQGHLNIPPLSCLSVGSTSNHFWVGSDWLPLKHYFLQKWVWVVAEPPTSQPQWVSWKHLIFIGSLGTTISYSVVLWLSIIFLLKSLRRAPTKWLPRKPSFWRELDNSKDKHISNKLFWGLKQQLWLSVCLLGWCSPSRGGESDDFHGHFSYFLKLWKRLVQGSSREPHAFLKGGIRTSGPCL